MPAEPGKSNNTCECRCCYGLERRMNVPQLMAAGEPRLGLFGSAAADRFHTHTCRDGARPRPTTDLQACDFCGGTRFSATCGYCERRRGCGHFRRAFAQGALFRNTLGFQVGKNGKAFVEGRKRLE
jgi:hypothetical protein